MDFLTILWFESKDVDFKSVTSICGVDGFISIKELCIVRPFGIGVFIPE